MRVSLWKTLSSGGTKLSFASDRGVFSIALCPLSLCLRFLAPPFGLSLLLLSGFACMFESITG